MDILADLNEPQRRAVTHTDGPLLVLAGAGSGKTRVIARRVGYLIGATAAPNSILAITFTNKAAQEMQQRVHAMDIPHGATICTFHSLCARLLREFAAEANLAGNYTIYDRADQLRILKEAIKRADLPAGTFVPSKVLAVISAAKGQLNSAEQFAAEASDFRSKNIARIYRLYEQLLASNNALDFDDLLLRMAYLLRDRPEIRQLLSRRYKYILIDEYQDTNRAQYILAHGIAVDHENICATGDPDQSIYTWRGADINNILEFETDYPNATVIRLEENYRSTKPILTAASHLISHNKMRKEKALWTRRLGGVDIHVAYCDDEHAEADLLAQRISARGASGGKYGEVAVFYRINALSRVLEEALIRASIPYQIARGVEFYNRKVVKDVLAYLKLLVNPQDDLSCLRIINTPARGIGATTIKHLRDLAAAKGISLLEAARRHQEANLAAAATKKVSAFGELIDSLGSGLAGPVRDVMENVVKRTGLQEALGEDMEQARQDLANIDELISTAAEFDEVSQDESDDQPITIGHYLHKVSLVSDVDHFDGTGGAVTLMTLHAAKGLEFPAVFIVGCENGLLPFERLDTPEVLYKGTEKLEEERRLAFVGMTRAIDELTLTCARYRMVRGQSLPQAASQFLTEIGTESVTIEDFTTARPVAPLHGRRKGRFYEDVEQRQLIEAMADAAEVPPEYEYLKVGSKVYHATFGAGRVVQISQPWPVTRAKVEFHQSGTKTLLLRLAKLELI